MEPNEHMLNPTSPSAPGSTSSGDGIRDMARNLANEAQQKAGEQVRSSIDKGRSRAADTLSDVARTLMQSNQQEENPASQFMTRAGQQVQRAADYLQKADMRQLVSETEGFARRQPALFLGGAFAIGVFAARFLKSGRPSPQDNAVGFGAEDRVHDRERSLSSFREPGAFKSVGGLPTDSMDDVDWPSRKNDPDSPLWDFGSTSRR